jgi:molybdopterin-guanine dinucleotide biosynthesis protein A
MGGSKPLRLLGERTLLDHAIERALGWSDTVAISARDPDQVGHSQLAVLLDPPRLAGPLAGLAAARQLGSDFVLTIPCDMPFLPGDLPSRLAAVLPGHAAALVSAAGRLQPVCGLWRTGALDGIEAYEASGRSSVVGFAREIGFATAELEVGAVDNVNTPDELAAAAARIA